MNKETLQALLFAHNILVTKEETQSCPRASPNRPTEWKLSCYKMLNQLLRVLSGTRCASEADSLSPSLAG